LNGRGQSSLPSSVMIAATAASVASASNTPCRRSARSHRSTGGRSGRWILGWSGGPLVASRGVSRAWHDAGVPGPVRPAAWSG
jgi:hypothetical protein